MSDVDVRSLAIRGIAFLFMPTTLIDLNQGIPWPPWLQYDREEQCQEGQRAKALSILISPKQISSIYFLLYIIKHRIVSVGNDSGR